MRDIEGASRKQTTKPVLRLDHKVETTIERKHVQAAIEPIHEFHMKLR